MTGSRSRGVVVALLVAAGLAGCMTAREDGPGDADAAAPHRMMASMTGAAMLPPVTTPATGTADVTFDPATNLLTWTVTFQDLSTPVTASHFHGPAPTTDNAGIQIPIGEGESLTSPATGSATLTDQQAGQLSQGLWYVVVHTTANPGGEIRGQVIPTM